MANKEHLVILNQGIGTWNAWRIENPEIRVDLSGTDLRGANLRYADLRGVNLRDTDLKGANLRGAVLSRVDLKGAVLCEANLRGSDLNGANLTRADIRSARVISTSFGRVDLRFTMGLEGVIHMGPSSVGMDTIQMSKGEIPDTFLRGCGLSDIEFEFAKLANPSLEPDEVTDINYRIHDLYCGGSVIYHTCFLSYSQSDQAFVRKLHDDLQREGVRCWFAPEDMKIGDRIRPQIDQEIRLRDKLLVILSENSVASEWVGDEVEAAFEEEQASGRTILFPIRMDDAVMHTHQDWAAKIKRRRHIGDFTGWEDETEYRKAFERLLRDLKASSEEPGVNSDGG